jgi:hypothetical protein
MPQDLGGVWILYSKGIFRISMHKMHFVKNMRCLVGILGNAKWQNAFCKFSFLVQKSDPLKNGF